MSLLIDPHVSPYSDPDDIEAWLAELAELREEYAGDEAALASIAEAEVEAREWLRDRLEREDDP